MSAAARGSARAEDVRSLLQATLGEAALGPREASVELGGGPRPVLRPADGETLATALRVLGEHRLPALVRGGGTRMPPGAAAAARVVLETTALGGVRELDTEEGVVRAGAGLPLAELAAALAESGWEAPLDPPGEAGTVGGALAAAAVGPRFGHPRDVVLGLDVVLATGERTRCGGRVVKNVTGYDLAKLHVGAFGALGVIEAAWLRLRPRPELADVRALALPAGDAGHALALEAARRPTARVAARLDGLAAAALGLPPAGAAAHGEGAALLLLELAGDAPAVEADLAWLAGRGELLAAGPDAVARVRAAQGGADEPDRALRVRIALRASRVAPVAAGLAAAGARTVAHPARGLLWARWQAPPAPGAHPPDEALEVARRTAGPGAVLRVEAVPEGTAAPAAGLAIDPSLAPLHRALLARFDPRGVLVTGRLLGGGA